MLACLIKALSSNLYTVTTMNPQKTAVVLIEFQNDFTSEGGTLHKAVKGVMDSTGMLENTQALAEKAREAGATIIHVPISFTDDYRELTPEPLRHSQRRSR